MKTETQCLKCGLWHWKEEKHVCSERTGGAASTSGALLPETRSGVGQRDPLISSEDAPLPDQAKAEAGELYEAIERLRTKALHLDDMAAKEFRDVPDARRRCQIKAGVYRSVYMDLKRYLPTAVAQSGVDRVEECQCEAVYPLVATKDGAVCCHCYLPTARGKRTERSGSGNAIGEARRDGTPHRQ